MMMAPISPPNSQQKPEPTPRFTLSLHEGKGFYGSPRQWGMPVAIIVTMGFAFWLASFLGGCTPASDALNAATWASAPPPAHEQANIAEPFRFPSPEEASLLGIRSALVLEAMKKQRHIALYDTWFANPETVKLPTPQELKYLGFMYCADRFLGPLKSYRLSDALMLQNKKTGNYIVNVVSAREHEAQHESQLHFQRESADFKLTGYYLKSDQPGFLNCVTRLP